MVVFTGGECTLLNDDLYEGISFAKKLGLSTRIVTNGHWCKDKTIGNTVVDNLIRAGLDEINFSSGNEHSIFVPIETLTNAVSLCAESQKFKSILISIELSSNSNVTIDSIFKSKHLQDLDDNIRNKIICINSPWIEFRKSYKYGDKLYKSNFQFPTQKGCSEILSTININPNGQFLSCCGLSSEYSPFLKLGKIRDDNVKILHNSRFDDIIKLWIFTDGPFSILNKIGFQQGTCNKHGCEYCLRLLNSKDTLNKLLNISPEQVEKILFDYNLITNRYEK